MTDKPRRAMPSKEEYELFLTDLANPLYPHVTSDGTCDPEELREYRTVQSMPERMSPAEIPNGGLPMDE